MVTRRTDSVDYGALFAALPAPHMVMSADDPAFTIIAENESHARLINAETPEYSIGKGLLEAYPDTSEQYLKSGKSALVESLRRVITTGAPDSMPDLRYDLADPDGTFRERWWRATHYPIKDAAGMVIQILQLTNDITEELMTKRELERTSAQFDLALEAGLVSTYNWDIQNDVITGDQNLARTFGVSFADVRAGLPLQRMVDSIFEADRARVGDAISKTVDSGEVYDIEYRTYRGDGSIAWVIARGTVRRSDNGTPLYFAGILIDITARKAAEAEAQNSKRMFDALFESTILSVALADTGGEVIQANKTFLRQFGYTKTDLKKGLTSRMLTAVGSRQITDEIYDAVRGRGEARPVEKQYVRKDGSAFTGLVGAVRVPGEDDRLIAFILDVTENRRLKEVNDAKDEFIALASHQLRTPATAVKQYLGIILEGYAGAVDTVQREYLQTAYDSNERELSIINDLLKTAQLDTKGFTLTPKLTDVVALVDDIIKGVTPSCEVKRQKITFTHDTRLSAHIDADETRIVLSNLIENAHKYSHAGTTITVDARKAGDYVRITVRDQGVGIAQSDLDSIFEKFTRVENPLSSVSGGNGLGLYWVKRIVTLHGGRLDVESEVGKGTVFVVELPL